MPESTMERVPYNSVINWNELVQLLSRLNEPLKVEVTDADDDVEASQGDELMVGQINMDRYAVSAVSDYDEKAVWTGEALPNETIRSAKIPTHFQLFPRHDKDHCFRSVREIIETLPAVYKLIFTIDGFESSGKYVKPKERLEMVDLVRDSATGSRLLLVMSLKTGMRITLNEKMEAPFFQLRSDCYKCGEYGISASDLLASWTPGQNPFIVRYLSPAKEVRQADLEKKFIGLKPDKKNKHRVKSSNSINVCQSAPHVRDCFPQHLQDRQLFFRPYYAATVQNITRHQDDIILSENSKLTVRILPSSERSRSAQSSVTSGHSLSSLSTSADHLPDIISKVNWRTTTFLITGGEIATTLRELDCIRKGHRIAVLKLENRKKAVMVNQRNEMFLVCAAYGGKFKCDPEYNREICAEEICEMLPPFNVEVIAQDRDIGHDQLHLRRSFKVNAIVTEWTACVEVFGSDRQKLSHQPFEIPLCRNPLHARADEPMSIFQTISLSKAKYVVKLPIVEMVTEDDVNAIRSYRKPEDMIASHQKFEAGIRSHQGAGDATRSYPRHEVTIRRSLGSDDEIFRSHQREEDGIRNYYGHNDAIPSYRRHGVEIRRSLGPEDEIFRNHQRLEDGIRNYHGHNDAIPSYRRHGVEIRRSLGPEDEIFRSHQRLEDGIRNYHGHNDAIPSYRRHGVEIRRSLGPDDEIFRSHQREEDGIRNYYGHNDAIPSYRRHGVEIRRSLGPEDEIFRNHQRLEDGIRNYHGHNDAIPSYRRHGVEIRRSLGPEDEIFRNHQRLEDGIRNYLGHNNAIPNYRRLEDVLRSHPMPGDRSPNYHGHDDMLRSHMRKEDGIRSVFNFDNVQAALLEVNSDEESFSPDSLYTKFNKMNPQPSTSDVPPPRPPKSPAMRRTENERLQVVETGDEILRLDITHAPVSPQRPPKPDRFKSPHHVCSSNNNNNNVSQYDDAAAINTRVQSKQDTTRLSLQDNLKSTAIEVALSPELSVNPNEKRAPQSSFEILHESYNPLSFTDENSNTNSYELLANTNSSNLPTDEYATYVNPSLLHKKHSKFKSARTIPNPNYEDSIQVTMISQQQDHKGPLNVTVNDANSRFQRRNAAENHQPSDYAFAVDATGCRGIRKTTLIDDNLDYEYIPQQPTKKHPDQELMRNEDEDYEVAVYEEMSH